MDQQITAITGMALGGLSFGLHIAAYVVYGLKAGKGQSSPNFATWAVWVLATALNAATYLYMSGDWVKALQPFAGAGACAAIFVLALKNGQFRKIGGVEWSMLLVSTMAVLVWYAKRDASYANLLLQSAFVISFIPTIKQIWRNPVNESALPWFMWGGAYVLLTATILMRWQGNAAELAYPINSFFWHSLAGVLTTRSVR